MKTHVRDNQRLDNIEKNLILLSPLELTVNNKWLYFSSTDAVVVIVNFSFIFIFFTITTGPGLTKHGTYHH